MFTAVVRLQVIPLPGVLINGSLNYDKELTRPERLLTQRREGTKVWNRFGCHFLPRKLRQFPAIIGKTQGLTKAWTACSIPPTPLYRSD
jgi:hypothetical protein